MTPPRSVLTLSFIATVRGGRLVLDEPVDMPEGSEVELKLVHDGDDLDDADRARLHEALRVAEGELEVGRTVDAGELLRALRGRRRA